MKSIFALFHKLLSLQYLAYSLYSYHVNCGKYNEFLVKRDEILFNFDVIDNWNNESENMNQGKKGKKFVI